MTTDTTATSQFILEFSDDNLRRFKQITAETEPGDVTIVSELKPLEGERNWHTTTLEMSDIVMFMYSFGMRGLKMKRIVSEEEEAAKQARIDKHIVRVDARPVEEGSDEYIVKFTRNDGTPYGKK